MKFAPIAVVSATYPPLDWELTSEKARDAEGFRHGILRSVSAAELH